MTFIRISLLFIFCCIFFLSNGQDVIELKNPSFEDYPHAGSLVNDPLIKDWIDCGSENFPRESPPDIHPGLFWSVGKEAYEGKTYLGLVVRGNNSWEAVAQKLNAPMQKGKCYDFSIVLCISPKYISGTSYGMRKIENFNKPAVLRIWGGNLSCDYKELLGESPPISSSDWETHFFEFNPKFSHSHIILEAFYKTPVLMPYNGHILLDHASAIVEKLCIEEE